MRYDGRESEREREEAERAYWAREYEEAERADREKEAARARGESDRELDYADERDFEAEGDERYGEQRKQTDYLTERELDEEAQRLGFDDRVKDYTKDARQAVLEKRNEAKETQQLHEAHEAREQDYRDSKKPPEEKNWYLDGQDTARAEVASAEERGTAFDRADEQRAFEAALEKSGVHSRRRTDDVAMAELHRHLPYGTQHVRPNQSVSELAAPSGQAWTEKYAKVTNEDRSVSYLKDDEEKLRDTGAAIQVRADDKEAIRDAVRLAREKFGNEIEIIVKDEAKRDLVLEELARQGCKPQPEMQERFAEIKARVEQERAAMIELSQQKEREQQHDHDNDGQEHEAA